VSKTATSSAIGGLVLTALHHRYSEISPVGSPLGFALLASAGAATVALAVAIGGRTSSAAEGAGPDVVRA
jgi:hypothetical protein